MSDQQLRTELGRVTQRYRVMLRSVVLIFLWVVLSLAGIAAIRLLRGQEYESIGAVAALVALLGLVVSPWLIISFRQTGNPLWLARRIEKRFPDLDSRLLAALEQNPEKQKSLGFLQELVIGQAVGHACKNRWTDLVPAGRLRALRAVNGILFLIMAAIALGVGIEMKNSRVPLMARFSPPAADYAIKVEPEDTSVERNTALLVMARFGGQRLPDNVELLYREGDDGAVQRLTMSRSLNDPLFAMRIAAVKKDGSYSIRYGDSETRWYKVSVFDFPALKQADADLKFPQYTGLEDKLVQDTRSVTAVEGTHVTLTFHLNKPVAEARLVPTKRPALPALPAVPVAGPARGGTPVATNPAPVEPPALPVALTQDPKDPTAYTMSVDLKQSQTYQLQLVDSDKRSNREQAQMALNVTVNRPPDLKVLFPNRDLDVSALEELTVKAQVFDDFGVKRVGMTYALAAQPPVDVVLAQDIPGKERRDISQLISLEKLGAEPDQLLYYHLWVEDIGPDGKTRRTDGAMYFADVRPYEEIFRQGQAQAQGQQDQQQRQQQQNPQSQSAQRAEQVANTLKQVIAATWNIQRRETAAAPSAQFVPDVTSVESSLTRVRDQAEALGDKITDERSQAFLASGLKNIDGADEQLKAAAAGPTVTHLPAALASEQAAYQDLLKLRAREFEVQRNNRGQQQANQNAAQNRRQQQVNQMNTNQQQNPYQTRRQSQQQQPQQNQQAQQETDEQRETRQVLSRLRDLAQRQDDLNRQMQQVQSALQQAQTQEQRDEMQRQLANLREQQQQQLRDADELRDRLDQPQNQEQMADARQQLDQTRDNIQQASQNLNNGQMQQAAAAGQRAAEQLNNLQEQMRRAAAGQFGEQMAQMRQDAQNLEQQQKQIDQSIADVNKPTPTTAPTGLRNANQPSAADRRQQLAQDVQQQKEQLQKLLDNMQQTIEQADTPQPLLSKQLYDTYRQAQQQQVDKAMDSTRDLVQQGLMQEARQADGDASQGVTRLREGVDQAAASILGDETDALRRARNELDALANQIDRELGQAATRAAATQPDSAARQLAANTTQPGGRAGQASTQPGGRAGAAGTQPGDRQLAQNDQQGQPGGRAGQPGARGNQPGGQQPQDRQLAGARGQNANPGQQPGQQPGQGQGQQPGQQPGEGQQANGQQPGQGQNSQGTPGARGAPGLRAAQNGQAARGGGRGQPGDAAQQGDQQVADAQGQQPGDQPGQPGQQGGARGGNRAGARGGNQGAQQANANNGGPITGDGFRDFTDSLRNIEETVSDPQLRAQATNIRQNVVNLRAQYSTASKPPRYDIVQDTVNRPLQDLRNAINQEILRRESAQAVVPLDKDAVPPAYQDQVRTYYERLGSGK